MAFLFFLSTACGHRHCRPRNPPVAICFPAGLGGSPGAVEVLQLALGTQRVAAAIFGSHRNLHKEMAHMRAEIPHQWEQRRKPKRQWRHWKLRLGKQGPLCVLPQVGTLPGKGDNFPWEATLTKVLLCLIWVILVATRALGISILYCLEVKPFSYMTVSLEIFSEMQFLEPYLQRILGSTTVTLT